MKNTILKFKNNKTCKIAFNIILILILLIYGFIMIGPRFSYEIPQVKILKNHPGDLIHSILRLAVLIFLIFYIKKCKEKIFKIIFSSILVIFIPLFTICRFGDMICHDEETLQKIDISKTESLENIYYPTETGFMQIVYKKKIIGTIYCQKVIYSIDYSDEKLEEIKIAINDYYDEIKDKKFGLCGAKLEYKRANYKNGKLVIEE